MLRFHKLFIFFISPFFCAAQDSGSPAQILSPQAFVSIVKKYHPVIKQADIQIDKANQAITYSRGNFDPQLYLNTDQKTFDGTNYYQYFSAGLKIPTWYGIELKAGIEDNSGKYLNSEITAGKSNYVGISVPLAKNLLMDKRRAILQQAKLFGLQSESEKKISVNNLLNEAYEAYWNWALAYQVYRITSEMVKMAETRFELTKTGFRQGDRPAIDTLEALSQFQNFQSLQIDTRAAFKNAGIKLSSFLWTDNNTYYQLDENVVPDNEWNRQNIREINLGILDEILQQALLNHPKLKTYDIKLKSLEVDRKLAFQNVLPTVNIRAGLLNEGYQVFKGVNAGFYQNNNKFGLDVSIPLRMSEGRGSYKMAKLKIDETTMAFTLQQQEIENKIRYYYNELQGLQNQIDLYEKACLNYQNLYKGEETRFIAGESTLFLMNSRENKVLEARQKLTELKAKFYKTQTGLLWAAGLLM